MEDKKDKKDKKRISRKDRIEMIDPEYHTGMLDGYARAIARMNQSKRDEILRRVAAVR
jgi:hypothetical protein